MMNSIRFLVNTTMPDQNSTPTCPRQEDLMLLQEIQTNLERLFILLDIPYQEQIKKLQNPPLETLHEKTAEIGGIIPTLLAETQQICSIKPFTDYMAFEKIINDAIQLLQLLISLQSSDLPKFYLRSHKLVILYWGIEYYVAKYELDQTPEFCENTLLFFNMPDSVFEFILQLKQGPKPVEILAEVDLQLRIDKRLPLLLSRTPDHISLSPLGEKFVQVHEISHIFFYYLYDFEEDVLGIEPS